MSITKSLPFYKYQGTGNDFVIVDNREGLFDAPGERIRQLCERRTGIGADGLILLEHSDLGDFRMVYYNADGKLSTLCGNGGRCLVSFAARLGLAGNEVEFEAIDGLHRARIEEDMVTLFMSDVERVDEKYLGYFVDTGSPHYVQVMDELSGWNVNGQGRRIRFEQFGPEGANINFVQVLDTGRIQVRTYERGVEAETLSCGTGVTAASIALHAKGQLNKDEIEIQTPGGILRVGFDRDSGGGYRNIYLKGPATFVYEGVLTI